MKKNKIKFYNEIIYSEKLDNGLSVYILPNHNVKEAFATLSVKYGGINHSFKLNNKYITVPNGIAHFLEHKLFEQEDGIDAFSYYSKSGTYCNAYTNYKNTTYLFAGNQDIYTNLEYLVNFVFSPYFTDSNVEKEKGIIAEEINMYDDYVDSVIEEKVIYNTFNTHPIKYSICGTINDINSITKENLYNVYNTFYNPSNMLLVVTGNVDEKKVISTIKNSMKNKKFNNNKIMLKKKKEKDKVALKKEVIKRDVTIPYVAYSIKIPIYNFDIDKKKLSLYLSNLFNILFDETSLFYERMKEKKYLNTPVDIENITTESHKVFIISFRSYEYNKVINEIKKVLDNINISGSDLERKKKVNLSDILYIFDDINKVNIMIINNIVEYDDLYLNMHNLISEMNIMELNDIISKLNLKNKSIVIFENRD